MKVICSKSDTTCDCKHKEIHHYDDFFCHLTCSKIGSQCNCFSIKEIRKTKLLKLNDKLSYT